MKDKDLFQLIKENHKKYQYFLSQAKKVFKKIEFTQKEIIFTLKKSKIKVITDESKRSALFETLSFGNYENKEIEFLTNQVKTIKKPIIIDVGAHIGWFSIQIAKHVPSAKIYSFEPIPKTYDILNKNIKINKMSNQITSYVIALSNSNKNSTMYYDETHSVLASKKPLVKGQEILVRERTLDFIKEIQKVKNINILKKDVEGGEREVLKGGFKTIEKYKPIIMIEIYPPFCKKYGYDYKEILKYFKKSRYQGYQLTKKGLRKITKRSFKNQKAEDSLQYNFFFFPIINSYHNDTQQINDQSNLK